MAVAQSAYALLLVAGVAGQIINGEQSNRISRTVESAAGLPFGQPAFRGANDHGVVIGAAVAGTAVGANGSPAPAGATITAAPVVSAGALSGVYKLVCLVAGATGKWALYDPSGVYLDQVITGTPYAANGLAFTITDSGTDPAVGEAFIITVTLTANVKFIGLAILDHVVPAVAASGVPDQYPQYYTAALMTHGQMMVVAGATVTDGDSVYWNPATGRYTNTTTHVRIPNCKFDTDAVNGGLVVISLKTRLLS